MTGYLISKILSSKDLSVYCMFCCFMHEQNNNCLREKHQSNMKWFIMCFVNIQNNNCLRLREKNIKVT